MEAGSASVRARVGWRLWALVPVLVLTGIVVAVSMSGDRVAELIGRNPPPADEFDIRRVEFEPGVIRILVRNPQRDDLTIANVNVDDAIVPFTVDGPTTLGRLRSSTIVVPFDWVQDDPITVGVTSSTGIQTVKEIPAAVETPKASLDSFFGYALIGLLVGVIPVALGLLWLPGAPARERSLARRVHGVHGRVARIPRCGGALGSRRAPGASPRRARRCRPRPARGRPELPRHDRARREARPRVGRDGLRTRAPRRDRHRRAQPRRGAGDRDVVRRRRAPARDVPDRRLHDPQRHRGARDRDPAREDALDGARAWPASR